MISGIILSNHVFTFLNIQGGLGFARIAHLLTSHWYYLFMSMHIGLHVATLFSALAFFVTTKGGNIIKEFSHTNWATIVLGIVITGLEVGFIFAYKAGWKVSTLATVSNALLAVILIFVGLIGYHEAINWNKVLGVAICLVGLYFINRK